MIIVECCGWELLTSKHVIWTSFARCYCEVFSRTQAALFVKAIGWSFSASDCDGGPAGGIHGQTGCRVSGETPTLMPGRTLFSIITYRSPLDATIMASWNMTQISQGSSSTSLSYDSANR